MTESTYRIQGATGEWEVVIGLEVHAQVTSHAKLFSGASTTFGAEPNAQVSLVDAAMPGMLPVPNGECVRQAVRTGMALNAQINRYSRFDRKNYFYADLPQGYQISQLYHPIVGEGAVEISLDDKNPDAQTKTIGIERLHLEQDAGKLMHDQHPTMSYVDLNRCGVALMEIVSRPDMRSPAEAGAYLKKLRTILRYVGSCDGNMEEGSMRADVNVSVRKPGDEFGTRTETKNVNSVRYVMATIEHEANRQVDVIESGGTIVQETRLYDPDKNETRSMRSKEDAHDYRYFPDPDLLPLEPARGFRLGSEHRCIVGRKTQFALVPLALGIGRLEPFGCPQRRIGAAGDFGARKPHVLVRISAGLDLFGFDEFGRRHKGGCKNLLGKQAVNRECCDQQEDDRRDQKQKLAGQKRSPNGGQGRSSDMPVLTAHIGAGFEHRQRCLITQLQHLPA
jgi:hypothetical protein